jgi:hypothetical protein
MPLWALVIIIILAVGVVDRTGWIDATSRFWFRKTVPGGYEFDVCDAESLAKKPAFDHQKLAASLSGAAGEKYSVQGRHDFLRAYFYDYKRAAKITGDEDYFRSTGKDPNRERESITL